MATRAQAQGLTAGLARLAACAPQAAYPHEALAAAARAFIDTVGVTLAGWSEPPTARLASACGDGREARAMMGGRRLSAADAALLNGMAGHVLDYDDVAMHGHPSVVLVAAILAEGQRLGASGEAALKAYVAGYEAWAELAWREADSYHLGAWHPTATLGVVAATVALAALNRLDETTAHAALGLAASFAGGVIANFGSPAKPLQAGRAAQNAVDAVRLARAGLGGAAAPLEGPHGLLRAISPNGRVELAAPVREPAQWRLLAEGLSVKRYPVCYASHRAIDAVIALRDEARLRPQEVAAVTVALGPAPAATLRFSRPRTGLEAKFSLHHNVAAALVDGAVGFAQLADDYVRREDVAGLYPLTRVELSHEECPEEPGMALHDRVMIETHDGRRLDSGPIRHPRGHARRPLGQGELDAKFLDCARRGGVGEGERLLERLHRLETLPSLDEVCA
jgi:2-methylcitrate dehydratase PrpD